jgi:acyl-CoA synthetase (NDP forming)
MTMGFPDRDVCTLHIRVIKGCDFNMNMLAAGDTVEVSKIIKTAKNEGRKALTEEESKSILKAYGVPVVQGMVVRTEHHAIEQARQTGYPVVLKGLGARLTHKTERGVVWLNLGSEDDVRRAAKAISQNAGADLEGYLVQPMLSGHREFVAGLFRDPQFGPVVMFGLGGVFTEALRDTAFRLAPMDHISASQMLDEISAKTLLGPFRGEAAVDREQIVKALVGLSRLAMEQDEVAEVDINPLLIGPDGRVTAVDALIIVGDEKQEEAPVPLVDPADLASLFYPRSIAFVGASGQLSKWGHLLFVNVLASGFDGDVFLVNAKGGEIAGRPTYKSVLEIPAPVDLGVVTIPAERVRDLIPQFKAKGIKHMLLISSGFSETGEEGKRLEEQLIDEARQADILVLGPNTMGICNPHINFYCTGIHVRPKAGSTAFIAQSGNLGTQLLAFAEYEGIGIRAFSGSGNEAMITIEDYMRGFEVDELTKTVVLYLESIKNGRRFYELARRVSRQKPVVVLKGGRTKEGSRAAASHTGALASNTKVFEASCRQAGIVLVEQPMDLLDLSAAFSSLPLPKGKRVVIMTLGGGWGVVATDLCIENGLILPALSEDLIAMIDGMLPPYWSRNNPIDLVGEFSPEIPLRVVEELAKWDQCDAIIHLGIVGRTEFVKAMNRSTLKVDPCYTKERLEAAGDFLAQSEKDFLAHSVRLMERYGKPILGASLLTTDDMRMIYEIKDSAYQGITFLTPEKAVKSLAKMCIYESWLRQESQLRTSR